MGEEVWKAVEKDWRSAPLRPELKATLVFLEKQTRAPDELTEADADAVRAAGVSDDALRDAATVSAMFNMIARLAEAFGWDVPPWEAVLERAPKMLEDGYEIDAIFERM
jgi:alkylhydroperoxidase family enzyme